MAGLAGDAGRHRKGCVCGPFHNEGKINYPLWWYGDQDILYNFAGHGGYVVLTNCAFMGRGQYFNGSNSRLLDEQGRKILKDGTLGLWSSINLDCTRSPACGSVTGSGTKLYLNNGNVLPPKITGSLVLHCPNLTHLSCGNNLISTLDVSALTSLTYLSCGNNLISTLDVSALTSLTYLNCYNNLISTLDVSALTSLTHLNCYNNSMDQAMVDTVLCDMDGHGTNNGTLNISSNAVPSATGIVCKNNLVGRGWTVTTD